MNRNRALFIGLYAALSVAIFVPTHAGADDTASVISMIQRNADYDNAGDTKHSVADYAPDAVIIDSIAPYIWRGKDAYAQWWRAALGDMRKKGMSEPFTKLLSPSHVEINGDRAYAVFPVIFTFKKLGKPQQQRATLTYALIEVAGRWRITGWAWSDD